MLLQQKVIKVLLVLQEQGLLLKFKGLFGLDVLLFRLIKLILPLPSLLPVLFRQLLHVSLVINLGHFQFHFQTLTLIPVQLVFRTQFPVISLQSSVLS